MFGIVYGECPHLFATEPKTQSPHPYGAKYTGNETQGAHTGAPLQNLYHIAFPVGADRCVCPVLVSGVLGAHTGAPLHFVCLFVLLSYCLAVGADRCVCPSESTAHWLCAHTGSTPTIR